MNAVSHQLIIRACINHMFVSRMKNSIFRQSSRLPPYRKATRKMIQLGIQPRLAIPAQVIPLRGELTNLLCPRKVEQLIPPVIDVLRRQRRAVLAVEKHGARPLELRLIGVHLYAALAVRTLEQLGDVVCHDHVGVEEQRCSLECAQVRDEETGERELGEPATLDRQRLERQRRDRYRPARVPYDAIRKDVVCNGLSWVLADENSKHSLTR